MSHQPCVICGEDTNIFCCGEALCIDHAIERDEAQRHVCQPKPPTDDGSGICYQCGRTLFA